MNLKKELFKRKVERIVAEIGENEAAYTECPLNLLYVTGLKLSAGALLVSKKGVILFVDGRYTHYANQQKMCKVLSFETGEIAKASQGLEILFNPKEVTYARGRELLERVGAKACEELFPFEAARMCKEPEEEDAISKSCNLLKKVYAYILPLVKTGVSEKEIAVAFERYAKECGAEKLAFEPIVAFGENSAMPHHRSSERVLQDDEVVLIDVGVMLGGYASDMTRTFFHGNVSQKIQTLYKAVDDAYSAAVSLAKDGALLCSLDEAVRSVFAQEGLEELYPHSLGHGVGLNVHEYPIVSVKRSGKELLREHMVITIEPGLYLPGVGGIRIEDTFLITKSGAKNLTR